MSQFEVSAASQAPEHLLREFEALDLSPYEARVLLALIRLRAANTAQLARVSGVPRTSTYQILEELNQRGLAERVAVEGPAMYASPGREQVFARLDAAQQERLRVHMERTARLRDLLEDAYPDDESEAGPYIHVIQVAGQVSHLYDKLLEGATSELLVFSRPPYSEGDADVNPAVADAVKRGVRARALYDDEKWNAPDAETGGFRAAVAAYHGAGVEGRLGDKLPLKLAIIDRRVALVALADPVVPVVGFPTTLLVDHEGFATLQAEAFDMKWAQATPM